MYFSTISPKQASGKRVLVRADLNVPIVDGEIQDLTRIIRFANGMKPYLDEGAKLIVMSHFGRPKGESNQKMSLIQISEALETAIGVKIIFSNDCIGSDVVNASQNLKEGNVLLCENLRFYPQEEDNDKDFADQLSKLGDIFINDAFSCAHRAHASTYTITQFIDSYFGPLMIEEINALNAALESPQSPSVAIVGGSKVSSKISVLKNLVSKLDALIIGGAMANTFFLYEKYEIGKSLVEKGQLDIVKEIKELANKSNCELILPHDFVCATELKKGVSSQIFNLGECSKNHMILDVGPSSLKLFNKILSNSKTILWNGPIGAFEVPPFNKSSITLAKHIGELTAKQKIKSVAGGGDTVSAINISGVLDKFSYVSSAGGAFLEWLEGKELPGILAIKNKSI